MTDLTLGQRIAECRKGKGLSQEALGEKVGVSRQAISKWEADGAVPEIDKLIALSKLFGVSIGWLLGIEEDASPAQNAEISEALLRKIEEIVLRYQPRSVPEKKPGYVWVRTVFAIVVAVALLATLYAVNRRLEQNAADVSSLSGAYSAIQGQLGTLTSRLDTIAQAEEEKTKLLSDYSFSVDPRVDEPMVLTDFSAVPKNWTEGDSAYLSFLLPDGTGVRPECVWDGAFLTASDILLNVENGYAMCLTIVHADGTREQQTLYDYTLEHLEDELTLTCEVKPGTAKFRLSGKKLTMEVVNCEVYVTRPGIAGSDIYFTAIEYILYQSSDAGYREVARYNLYKQIPITEENAGYGPEVWCYGEPTFTVPEINDGDGLELWVRAELSNGMSAVTMVDSWAYNNGEFIGTVPVEE